MEYHEYNRLFGEGDRCTVCHGFYGDSVHSKAQERKCDNNCLAFIKNGFCMHTGYPEAPTDGSWQERYEEKFGDRGDERYGHVKHNNTMVQRQIDWIASLIQKEREKGYSTEGAAYDFGLDAAKSEAFSLVREGMNGWVGDIVKEIDREATRSRTTKSKFDYDKIKGKLAIFNNQFTSLLSTLEGK